MTNSERQLRRYSRTQKSKTIFVGVTGHRDLDVQYQEALVHELGKKSESIQLAHPGQRVILLTALANGPDQWAALAARDNGLDYIAVLPMKEEDYLRESVLFGLDGRPRQAEEQRFRELLVAAAEKIHLSLDKQYEKSNAYRLLGEFLVRNCDHLIGIWDGLYNGKPGGTSDVMDMAYTLKNQQGDPIKRPSPLTVHWLSSPRTQNPFPVLKPLTWQVYDPDWSNLLRSEKPEEQKKRHRRIKEGPKTTLRWIRGIFLKKIWIPITLLLTFVFGSLGYQEEKRLETEFFLQRDWQEVVNSLDNLEAISQGHQEREGMCFLEWNEDATLLNELGAGFLSPYENVVKRTLAHLQKKTQNHLHAFTGSPESVVLLRVELDKLQEIQKSINELYLYQVRNPKALLDGIVYASGLLFAQPTLFQYSRGNYVKIALTSGFLFLILTSIRILDLLVFHKFFNQFRLNWFLFSASLKGRVKSVLFKNGSKPELTLLVGLGKVGKEIAFNFLQWKQSHQKLVMMDLEGDDPAIELLEDKGAVFFRGDGSRRETLALAHLNRVKEVFITGESDETNVRALQQLDTMYNQQKLYLHRYPFLRNIFKSESCKVVNTYLQVTDYSIRFFLKESIKSNDVLRTNTFYLNEELSRSLLKKFPLDRTEDTREGIRKSTTLVLVGYTAISLEIARYMLNTGHYSGPKGMAVNIIFLTPDPIHDEEHFYGLFPFLKDKNAFIQYVFPGEIHFKPLPVADSEMLDDDGPFFNPIEPSAQLNYYFCLEDGVRNASLLAIIQEKLEIKRKESCCDIQAFYYYNHPEQEGNSYVATQLSKKVGQLPVFGFGSLYESCRLTVIRKTQLDFLAKQVAFLYYLLYEYQPGFIASLDGVIASELGSSAGPQDLGKVANMDFIRTVWQSQYLPHFLPDEEDNWLDPVWATLSEEHKESNRFAADHLDIKWRALGLSSADKLKGYEIPDAKKALLAEMEHRRWCAEKLLLGFTPFRGSLADWKKDGSNLRKQRKHIDLMPFDDLKELDPKEQQKDYNLIEGMTFFYWAG